ncbi:hypothetical protein [Parathalassolituus penaei]|uniref:Cxxc_20_cxxc protein n=1 Tax=Parathalassolituus penaei TaxID=2997323 RepID=A0A9X3EBL6_9GAMM|nr:hypothetical protein [Parathalassolituus penaei]MCY0963844.1 hypothetical protein [Parathalassolituus penaei]
MYCPDCGRHVGFFRRFIIRYTQPVMLPCRFCGAELVDKDRIFAHLLLTGFIFSLLLGVQLPVESGWWTLLLDLGVPWLYYELMFPMRHKEVDESHHDSSHHSH